MDIAVQHSLTYSTRGDVPVSLVARSLLANEALLIASIRTLEKCTPGMDVSSISVKVSELSNSSPLREAFIVSLYITFQHDLETKVPQLIEQLTGAHIPQQYDSLVTVLALTIAIYVIASGIERVMPGKSVKKLKEEYERKKDRISELSGVSKETIERYIAKHAASEKAFLKHVVDFFAPARIEGGISILLQNGEVAISSDAIEEIPPGIDLNVEGQLTTYELSGTVVDIHRSDRDENKHGWRAVIESISDRKVRMELAPTINPETLWGRNAVVGDVTVIEERARDLSYGPKVYYLNSVRDPENSN